MMHERIILLNAETRDENWGSELIFVAQEQFDIKVKNIITLTASSRKHNITAWRPSVCPSVCPIVILFILYTFLRNSRMRNFWPASVRRFLKDRFKSYYREAAVQNALSCTYKLAIHGFKCDIEVFHAYKYHLAVILSLPF